MITSLNYKNILFGLILHVNGGVCLAQNDTSNYMPPKFIGGTSAFEKYAGKYISYPKNLADSSIVGEVNATIYINKSGKVKFVNAIGNIPAFNSEVKRVFKLMPDWEPGLKNGEPIDTMIFQRVVFSIKRNGVTIDSIPATKNDITIVSWTREIPIQELSESIAKSRARQEKLDNAFFLNEEGIKLFKQKKYNEALVEFNYAIKNGGNINLFLYNRGLTYLNLNEYEKAKADFLEAYRQGDEEAGKVYNELFK